MTLNGMVKAPIFSFLGTYLRSATLQELLMETKTFSFK